MRINKKRERTTIVYFLLLIVSYYNKNSNTGKKSDILEQNLLNQFQTNLESVLFLENKENRHKKEKIKERKSNKLTKKKQQNIEETI